MSPARLFTVLAVVALAGGAAYYISGRGGSPKIEIVQPRKFVGRSGTLEIIVDTPAGQLSSATITLEQGGTSRSLFSLGPNAEGEVNQESADCIRIRRPFGKYSVPELQEGPAELVVTAARPVFFGWRSLESRATQALSVRLSPPRVGIVLTHHHVNHGAATGRTCSTSNPLITRPSIGSYPANSRYSFDTPRICTDSSWTSR